MNRWRGKLPRKDEEETIGEDNKTSRKWPGSGIVTAA
jgi:hypothetical protein